MMPMPSGMMPAPMAACPGMMPGPMMMPNPMMMGGMGMPMMAGGMPMMAGGMPMMADGQAQAASTETVQPKMNLQSPINPSVRSLCANFGIEDRLMRKLNDVMMRRPETFEDDLQTLREKLSVDRPDIGVLITQLDRGLFVGKG